MPLAYWAALTPFHFRSLFLFVVFWRKQMNRQALGSREPRLAADFPDLDAICMNQVDRFFVVLQPSVALSFTDVETFLSSPKGIDDRPIGHSPRPAINAVESILNSKSSDESEMLVSDGFSKLLVRMLMDQDRAGCKQEFLLHFVANLLRILHWGALVTGHDEPSELFGSSLERFFQCPQEFSL